MEFPVSMFVPFQAADVGLITLHRLSEYRLVLLQRSAAAVQHMVRGVRPNFQVDSQLHSRDALPTPQHEVQAEPSYVH